MAYVTPYDDIPRIDFHVHLGRYASNTFWPEWHSVRTRVLADSNADVALVLDLDGGSVPRWIHNPATGLSRINQYGAGRVVGAMPDYKPAQGLWSSSPVLRVSDVPTWIGRGFVGIKWHWGDDFNSVPTRPAPYGMMDDPFFDPYYAMMEENGIPLTCFHFSAPLGNAQAQAAAFFNVLDKYPDLIVIQAHFGSSRLGLTPREMSAAFARYPNWYRDISTTAQHLWSWDTYATVRQFFIDHADRLLYGTDIIASHTGGTVPVAGWAKKYSQQFRYWETDEQILTRDVGLPSRGAPEYVRGMDLPRSALELIYEKNARRLIAPIDSAMTALGWPGEGTSIPTPTNVALSGTVLSWTYSNTSVISGFEIGITGPGSTNITLSIGKNQTSRDLAAQFAGKGAGDYLVKLTAMNAAGVRSVSVERTYTISASTGTFGQACVNFTTGYVTWVFTAGASIVTHFDLFSTNASGVRFIGSAAPAARSAKLVSGITLPTGTLTVRIIARVSGGADVVKDVTWNNANSGNNCSA